jgi:hypothetical protein
MLLSSIGGLEMTPEAYATEKLKLDQKSQELDLRYQQEQSSCVHTFERSGKHVGRCSKCGIHEENVVSRS